MEALGVDDRNTLQRNLAQVIERVRTAAVGAGRAPESVRLVAVTKSVGPAVVQALASLGQVDFGENRPEVIALKARSVGGLTVRWHLIGTYQSRKVRDTLVLLHRIHSVHKRGLLDELERHAALLGREIPCLLQLNVAREASKQGFDAEFLEPILDELGSWPHLRIDGLMAMAPLTADPGLQCAMFAGLRDLRDRVRRPGVELPELSMGMSGDFEAAIAEGATLIRVGSALFSGLRTNA